MHLKNSFFILIVIEQWFKERRLNSSKNKQNLEIRNLVSNKNYTSNSRLLLSGLFVLMLDGRHQSSWVGC